MFKKLRLLIFLFLCVTALQVYGGGSPRVPERGYPEGVPYVRTGLAVVSIHCPSMIDPPVALVEMPRLEDGVGEWDLGVLPHTESGDEVRDITGWFPLDEMREEDGGEDLRRVFYNVTSGYVIAKADHFLQASVYDYFDGGRSDGDDFYERRVRTNMIYLETDDRVSMDLGAIQKTSHKVIFRHVGEGYLGSKMVSRSGDIIFESEGFAMNGRKAIYLDLNCYKEGEGVLFNSAISFPVSKWMIFECGISEAGSRRILAVKVDYVNERREVIYLPPIREDFIKNVSMDPFGEGEDSFYELYAVPPDIIKMLSGEESDGDPFLETRKVKNEGIDISDLLLGQGVEPLNAYFLPRSSYVIASGSEEVQGQLDDLFATLGGDRPLGIIFHLSIYEVDGNAELKDWDVRDLLASRPHKLASVGTAFCSGTRSELFSDGSEFRLEAIRGESRENIDYDFNLKLDFSQRKMEKVCEGSMKIDRPELIWLGIDPTTKRDLYMLLLFREID